MVTHNDTAVVEGILSRMIGCSQSRVIERKKREVRTIPNDGNLQTCFCVKAVKSCSLSLARVWSGSSANASL